MLFLWAIFVASQGHQDNDHKSSEEHQDPDGKFRYDCHTAPPQVQVRGAGLSLQGEKCSLKIKDPCKFSSILMKNCTFDIGHAFWRGGESFLFRFIAVHRECRLISYQSASIGGRSMGRLLFLRAGYRRPRSHRGRNTTFAFDQWGWLLSCSVLVAIRPFHPNG